MVKVKSPFSWFGGKSRVADVVWQRLGAVKNYCEPFAGSLAVLLARPHVEGIETINDADGMLVNFWRATRDDPTGVVGAASEILNAELELRSKHRVIREARLDLADRLARDDSYFDSELAGTWLWGVCNTVAEAWHRHTPQRPAISTRPQGVFASPEPLEQMTALAKRLSRCRILCGDWTRAVTPERTRDRPVAILLDPPYGEGDVEYAAGGNKGDIASQVAEWAVVNGNKAGFRIAYCGYEGCYSFPEEWECHEWKSTGGFGNQANKDGRENAKRERIWFSPHCVKPEKERTIFDLLF